MRTTGLWAVALCAAMACDSGGSGGGPGAAGADAATGDAVEGDVGSVDAVEPDAGGGSPDAGSGDAGGGDATEADAGGVDTTEPDAGGDVGVADASSDASSGDCTVTVEATEGGAGIQAALIAAAPGDTICLGAGSFTVQSELSSSVAQVTLRGAGMEQTILDFTDQLVGANGLKVTGNGTTIEDFKIVDPAGDGVRADAVDGFTARRIFVLWTTADSADNGGYGLYPIQSHDVLIEECVMVGASDTGVYVGQSTNVLVRSNEAYGNVAGIEIENTSDAEVVDNYTHDNAAGILVFNLPDLPVQDGRRTKVHHNRVENNNNKNFATAGNIVAMVPSGTGIMVLASDENEIHDNTIEGNQTAGVLIMHYASLLFGELNDAEFDRYPEGNWVHDNQLADNGNNPKGVAAALPVPKPIAPLAWDGCTDPEKEATFALRNCFSGNGEAGFVDFDLCGDFETIETDLGAVTCEHQALPEIVVPDEGP